MLLAGLDGITNKIDPRQQNFGPFEEDIFYWPAEKRRTIKNMPYSLEGALDALEQDHQFLVEHDVFSEEFINSWIAVEKQRKLRYIYPGRILPR